MVFPHEQRDDREVVSLSLNKPPYFRYYVSKARPMFNFGPYVAKNLSLL